MEVGKVLPVLWVQGGTCTGCSVSVLNVVAPSVKDLLVEEVLPGKALSLRFQATLMVASGELALKALKEVPESSPGGYLLVVEGAVPTGEGGVYCVLGEREGRPLPFKDWVLELSEKAMAVIALGTCSSFGGIPAAWPNPTGAKGLKELFEENGLKTPLINVPGCPPHPDWFVGTVLKILLYGLPSSEELDEHLRPRDFYWMRIHENCPRRGYFEEGVFASKFGEPGCLYFLGCKGPVAHADCPLRKWNNGRNWCIDSGMGCQGCTEPGFPDLFGPFYEKPSEFLKGLETFNGCFTCQTCTNVCPVVSQYEDPKAHLGLLPHQIMVFCALGQKDKALEAPMVWRCVSCFQCQKFCPQKVRVGDVMVELKGILAKKWRETAKGKPPSLVKDLL